VNIFIDTSAFLAVLDQGDAGHAKATQAWTDILSTDAGLVTTNYVVVETCALVQNRLGLKALRVFHEDLAPILQIQWVDEAVHHAAVGTLLAVARTNLSLVDCVSFEIMRLLGIASAFTLDKHFKEQGFRCFPA
jgi:predicted nucleic acid-binding protein